MPRQPYAFGLDEAFRRAKNLGFDKIIVIEFGVAQGAGLFNLANLSEGLSIFYNVDYKIIGFDTGVGMPKPIDYRDHPEKYRFGDFPPGKLSKQSLPKKTEIIYGAISKTVPNFIKHLNLNDKISFVSIDVDYYSSTMECFEVFKADSNNFLPSTVLYFDDVNNVEHNNFMGEPLAINEFNQSNKKRKISKMNQLKNWRIFKNALWLDQMFFLHVLDAEYRDPKNWENTIPRVLENPYLR